MEAESFLNLTSVTESKIEDAVHSETQKKNVTPSTHTTTIMKPCTLRLWIFNFQ